jgi:hypothetical protein
MPPEFSMSYDPTQPPYSPPPSDPGGYPYGDRPPNGEAAKARVLFPAMGLIFVGILNLVWSLGSFGLGLVFTNMTADQLERMIEERDPQRLEEAKKGGVSVENLRQIYQRIFFGWGGLSLISMLFSIVGGIQMLRLKTHGLALFGAVMAGVPCVSPCACPCILGMAVGLWAFMVLIAPDVRAAFR